MTSPRISTGSSVTDCSITLQLWPIHVPVQQDRCRKNKARAKTRRRRKMYDRSSFYTSYSLAFQKDKVESGAPGLLFADLSSAYTFHAYGRTEGVAGIIISDPDYPALVAHQLLSKVVDEFLSRYPRSAFANSNPTLDFPQLKEYIVKYQDPQQADSIMKIQKELDETKIVLHKTIESVLERGEKIDSLVEKSDGLSAQSKMFYSECSISFTILQPSKADANVGCR